MSTACSAWRHLSVRNTLRPLVRDNARGVNHRSSASPNEESWPILLLTFSKMSY